MQLNKAYIKQGNKSQPNLRDICGLRKLFPTVALYFLTFVDGEKYARHIELRRSRRDIGHWHMQQRVRASQQVGMDADSVPWLLKCTPCILPSNPP